ncbi:hypothetical protein A3A95_04105 [Candidatus Nomurabacteria bacterium RIFCSPLOWO2_01_FULL_39_18]|uniref:Putative endonuclease Z1 domain-containing protein n=1 Tax=Candidatus Nomurabacteria bacterium RIFCSPHIGHO2_01_FULL_40_24b TaxID=1801739 RepID=A0A1F6V6S5_9BACT|nr:MAG: hypothetical protein A2647_04415 [Candidatus Nomurabacteria bacterium RIFCSPHIGHO2_01_FULL_40_24b]OGI89284.1 MAG: hypothetical protein A3A95_04105 [Candidatus Nomurabacteria bacterium RIFCSPLOWO2_01_FULL_39_18]
MRKFLDNYLKRAGASNPGLVPMLEKTAEDFAKKHIDNFDHNSHVSGLLYGHVQSGKTGQMLAIAAAAADRGFKFFILVTTSNVILHKQTLERAKNSLGGFMAGFNVFGETDEAAFLNRGLQMPTMIVLKKDPNVLKTWANNIASNPIYKEEPLFLLDDEADASSLNTRVNQNDQSTINKLLEKINKQAPSSIYLHVTATPQSLVLQIEMSGWKPQYSFYLPPGKGYLGGDFFYGEDSKNLIETEDNERDDLLKAEHIPVGLRKAVLHFLIAASDLLLGDHKSVCTMLIHPGSKISEHTTVRTKVEKFLEGLKTDLVADSSTLLELDLRDAWEELSKTKSRIKPFKAILDFLRADMPGVNITVLNSKAPEGTAYDEGLNIVIGGNTLGRGVTFPGLQIVYYCRSAKTPQADTSWQHARIFGYDRDRELCRIFSPQPLIKLFRELNDANNALFDTLQKKGPQAVSLLTPKGARPTRLSVVLKEELMIIAGGVNYFPLNPTHLGLSSLDRILGSKDREDDISLAETEKILHLISVEKTDLWNQHSFADCVGTLKKGAKYQCRMIIRTGRSISKGTGTLLSPTDRDLGNHFNDRVVLTLYRLNGETNKGWEGRPLWVPNIKFPDGTYFYYQLK